MKKVFLALFVVVTLSLTNCGSSKATVDPNIGTWNLIVKDTPQGNIATELIISKNEANQYVGNLNSALGNSVLQDLSIEASKLVAKFQIQGMDFSISGKFEKANFDGLVAGMGEFYKTKGTKLVTP